MSSNRPTFHESWYRVRELRPRLRSTVQTIRQHYRGRLWHVVQDPSNNQHFRLDEAGFTFLAMLDGHRSVEEVWRICNEQLGDRAPTQGEVINLLGQLYTSNLLRSDLPADAAGMFENYRRRVRREVGGYFMNLLFMRIPLFDPDHLLERWTRIAGPLFSHWALAAWGALMIVAGVQLAGHEGDLFGGVAGVLAPENLFLLYLSFAVLKAIHEFGHGFACKRFGLMNGQGGEVHTMGIMLLVFTPVPYVDASSSWAFRSRWQRAAVGAAGMYVELACAAVAAIVWANTSPGLVHALAYNIIFVASVSTLLFNGNPLLRFDGYYVLSDLLEIPNLAQRSKTHFYYIIKRWVFGVRQATTPVRSPGERFWLPVYFVTSTIYRVFIFAGIILFVADKFFFIGAAFAVVSIVSWLFIPAGKFIRYLGTSPDLARVRPRAQAVTAAFVGLVVLGLGIIPFPDRDRAEGVLEPEELAFVFVREDGFLRSFVPSGTFVTPDGPPLVTAENIELETALRQLTVDRHLTHIEYSKSMVDEIALAQSLRERLAALDGQIAQAERRLDALAPHAPIAGTWISPQVDGLIGAYGRRGEPVGMIASLDRLLVRAITDQGLGPRIEPEIGVGGTVEIRVKGRPDLEFTGTIADVLPGGFHQLPSAALGYLGGGQTEVEMDDERGTRTRVPFFEVRIDVPPETVLGQSLWSGQRVIVRFTMPAQPLAFQWWRSLRQLVQRRFQDLMGNSDRKRRRPAPGRRPPALRPGSTEPPPSEMWRMLAVQSAPPPKTAKGLDAIWNIAAGRVSATVPRTRRYMERAGEVAALEREYAALDDGRLRQRAGALRETFRLQREQPEDLRHAFALAREVAFRAVHLKPYVEQVAAGLAIHDGCVAEMATGEGKTLAATMPAIIAGWRGRGCHIVTVNDYLASRDDRNMAPVYRLCGLRCAHVVADMPPPQRREAYLADVTYTTNKEVAADFLRDRLALGRLRRLSGAILARLAEGRGAGTDRLVMRGLDTVIIDEADSILIDEAVTPLIISGDAPNQEQVTAYRQAAAVAADLQGGRDYRINQRYREVNLTRTGKERVAGLSAGLGGLWAGARRREELVEQALTAIELFRKEKQYVLQDDKVVIVDEFTGRLMPDRTWRAGLHQAVEAKEGLDVQAPKETLARISFQRFFRLYRQLGGMTGTAWEARHELHQIYGLNTVVLPTHRPCVRDEQPDRVYATADMKWNTIVDEIAAVHAEGRPVLVGTRSVQASEQLSRLLMDRGLAHQVLNAVRHAEEAGIVAQAGQKGRITVATNMAGRGTDIKLGRGVADLGGLHVIATERHESGRVDRQLFGRAGRQGDPGSAVAYVSLEDELVRRHLPEAAGDVARRIGAGDGPVDSRTIGGMFSLAQTRAESLALRQRKMVLRNDDWLDEFLGFAGRE